MLSSGQVYLVREGLTRPFAESDYAGPTLPAPPPQRASDHSNWLYGINKRAAEDALQKAWDAHRFPVAVLRLPMVNSERDHYDRLYGYLARLRDGGPIVIPDGPRLALRHVYGADVVQAVMRVIANSSAAGRAYNISQMETVTIEDFLDKLARLAGAPLRVVSVPAAQLEAIGFFASESHFSGRWMSALDNRRSLAELGMQYTALDEYLAHLVAHYRAVTRTPVGYELRPAELRLAGFAFGPENP
jgi:nucleoside-diphosphate-sugar epimerase